MKQIFKTMPGYDHIRHPCGKGACRPESPRSGHGIHCEEWFWILLDEAAEGGCALSLCVLTGIVPESVPTPNPYSDESYPAGTALVLHLPFPTSREQVLEKPSECEFLPGGKCWTILFSYEAAERMVARGEKVEKESAEVFARLETIYPKLLEGVERCPYVRCPACGGEQTMHEEDAAALGVFLRQRLHLQKAKEGLQAQVDAGLTAHFKYQDSEGLPCERTVTLRPGTAVVVGDVFLQVSQ